MADEPNTPDPDEEYFGELLSKKGPQWLTEQLKALGLDIEAMKTKGATPAAVAAPVDFAAFLGESLKEAKTENKALRDQLFDLMTVLTPEQRTLLQSRKGGNEAPPSDLPPTNSKSGNAPGTPPAAPAADPAKPPRKLFTRL